MTDQADEYESIADVPDDVMEIEDRTGTKWHRGPERLDWWWAEWDDGEGPETSDELDDWRPFTWAPGDAG
jgi:hypothetical protein